MGTLSNILIIFIPSGAFCLGFALGIIFQRARPSGKKAMPVIGQYWLLDGVGQVRIEGLEVLEHPQGLVEPRIAQVQYTWENSKGEATIHSFLDSAVLLRDHNLESPVS